MTDQQHHPDTATPAPAAPWLPGRWTTLSQDGRPLSRPGLPRPRPADVGPSRQAAPGGPARRGAVDWEAYTWITVARVSVARAVLATMAGLVLWATLPLGLGWTPRVIVSGSMEPRIGVGDIVVTRPVEHTEIAPSAVIIFADPDQPGRTRTHRVVRRAEDGAIVTRGDANPAPDSTPVAPEAVLGLGVIRVPYVGLPAVWVTDRHLLPLAVGYLALAGLVLCGWRPRRPSDPPADPRSGMRDSSPDQRPPRLTAARWARALPRTAAVLLCAGATTTLMTSGPTATTAGFTAPAPVPSSSFAAAMQFYPYLEEVRSAAPFLYWKLDETSGTVVSDSGGANRPGTLTSAGSQWGQPGALNEPPDRALNLTTAVITAAASNTGPTTFSLEAWIKTSSAQGGRILGFGNASGQNASTTVDRQLYLGTNGRVYFGVGSNRTVIASNTTLNDDRWHHVVATYSGTGNNGMRLYVDGTQRSTGRATTISMTGFWRAGAEQMTSWTSNPGVYFDGALDELAVYPRALTASEVQSHFDAAGS